MNHSKVWCLETWHFLVSFHVGRHGSAIGNFKLCPVGQIYNHLFWKQALCIVYGCFHAITVITEDCCREG